MKHALFSYADDDGGGGGDDGSQTVEVGSDDSILSIAKANGFWWSTVWNHPNNAALKAQRKDPEVLQEGDKVYVPKAEPKKVAKPNEATHKFKLLGEQAKFKIQLMMMDEARANEDYVLVIDGVIKTGKTDGNGMIETDIPNDAKGGELKLQGGKEVYPVSIGRLDPADSPDGVRQRLSSLGFDDVPDDDDDDDDDDSHSGGDSAPAAPDDGMPHGALKAFQTKYNLTVSGELDDATKAKLKELHPA